MDMTFWALNIAIAAALGAAVHEIVAIGKIMNEMEKWKIQ